jgi:hypothetical protein
MLVGNTPPIVYMQPTDSESYQVGEALKLASGKVTLCSGAVAPSHVCVGPIDDNGVVPCVEVQKYMEFETTLGVAPTDSATVGVGDKVTLHTDGMQVTATKTGGVAEVTGIDGQTVGSRVTVKF